MIINRSLKTQNRKGRETEKGLKCGTRILRVIHGRDARATSSLCKRIGKRAFEILFIRRKSERANDADAIN